MNYIFINTEDELNPGDLTAGEIFPRGDGQAVEIALKVIRPASFDEYITWVDEMGLSHMVNRSILDMKFFYCEVLD